MKDLASNNTKGSSLAIKKADEYLEREGKRNREGQVTQDRTVITQSDRSSESKSVSSSAATGTEAPNRETGVLLFLISGPL